MSNKYFSITYLDVCDGNLEEGSLRCDCNVSVKKKSDSKLGTRVEIKNLNSFRFIEKAIAYEIDRQIESVVAGGKIIQETRLYDPDKNKTYTMRIKEDADDYRYFPDPDLLPIRLDQSYIENLRRQVPELPVAKKNRFQKDFGLSDDDATLLTSERNLADYFESVGQKSKNYKASASWIMVEFLRELKDRKFEINQSPISSDRLAELIRLIDSGSISGKIAKKIFEEMWTNPGTAVEIQQTLGLVQISDTSAIEKIVADVLAEFPDQVAEYKSGKTKVIGFFVGQIMKRSKGQASPDIVNSILMKRL